MNYFSEIQGIFRFNLIFISKPFTLMPLQDYHTPWK